jgi:hypothetical protein
VIENLVNCTGSPEASHSQANGPQLRVSVSEFNDELEDGIENDAEISYKQISSNTHLSQLRSLSMCVSLLYHSVIHQINPLMLRNLKQGSAHSHHRQQLKKTRTYS